MLAVLFMNRMCSNKRTIQSRQTRKMVKSEGLDADHKDEYCRTCLSTEDLVSIFYNKETEEKRSQELKLVTGLEIKMNDGLSQKICSKCIDTMNVALQFRRTSKKAEKSLRNMLNGLTSNLNTRSKKRTPKLEKPLKTNKPTKVKVSPLKIEQDFPFPNQDEVHDDDGMDGGDFQTEDYEIAIKEEPTTKTKQKTGAGKKRGAHPAGSPYKCPTCGKEFRMKATYKAHLRFHTNFCVCESCGKRCRNNNQLQEHKRARHGLSKIHKCTYCEYSSATKEALTIHERRHTGERPYICDHCGAPFHRRSNLVQHMPIHLTEKNFQCDMCPKRLASRKFLQIHKHNAHTGRRYGYLCPVCKHRFEKPNKCPVCPKRAKSLKLLKIHQYKYHRENKYRYVCPVCQDTFTRPGNVRQHLVRSHRVPRDHQGVIERLEINYVTEKKPEITEVTVIPSTTTFYLI